MVQIKVKRVKGLIASSLLLTLVGCANNSGGYIPPVEERSSGNEGLVQSVEPASTGVVVKPTIIRESRTEVPVPVPVPTRAATQTQKSPAVIALLQSADKQKNSGAMQAAQSSLERAQRIAPRDPDIYYRLADLKRLSGQWQQAEQLALKGTNLAVGDAITLRRLWLLIADIRESAGQINASQKALQQALRY